MVDFPQLREGQTVSVFQKTKEGKRERIVLFSGKLIKVRGIGVNKTITVRQNLEGFHVDKIFPLALPTVTKIEVVEQVKSLTKGHLVVRKKAKKARKATKRSSKK